MRKYTLLVSVLAHTGAVAVLLLAPLFAAEILPDVFDRTEWTPVIAVAPPPPPPPPRQRPMPPAASAAPAAIPTTAPEGVQPEKEVSNAPAGLPTVDDGVPGTGHFHGVPFGRDDADALPPPPVRAPQPPVRVGGGVQRPVKMFDVAPVYPQLAVRAGREGNVILEAIIGEDGGVRDVRVLRSVAMLDDAAMEAVRQWRFTPTLLNGEPVAVLMTVTVTFRLDR